MLFRSGCFMINIFGKQNASAAAKKLDTKKELRKKKAAKGQVCVAAKSVKKKMDPNASRLQQMGNVEKSKNKKLSKRLVSLKLKHLNFVVPILLFINQKYIDHPPKTQASSEFSQSHSLNSVKRNQIQVVDSKKVVKYMVFY